MVKVNIYLSTLERLKADATDYDTRFTEGNLALFSKIVEKDSYKISYGFSYGSTPKTSTFACKLSAEPYYIKAFEAYDAIKVTKVKNDNEEVVFLGCKPTIKRTYETADWWSETITFNDYVSDLSDIVFHTSDTTTDETTTVTETKDDDWTWSISVEDGYKVCDSTDRTKSLVHYLFDNWLNKDRESLSFTLHCDFSNTDTVTSFSVQASDKVLNIWQELLKQQGLAVYIIGFDVYIIDMLADPTTTAKVIDSVECNATYNVKPYIEHTIPALRVPKVITTFTAQELYDSGKIPVAKGSIGMVDGSMGIKPKWYPDENTALYAEPSFTTELENYEVIRYYNMKWKYQTTVSLGTTRLYLYNGTEKVEKTLTKQGNWYGCTDSLSGKYLKYAVANYSLSQGNFTLTITGDVDVADYNAVIRPKSLYYSGSEEKATYVYTKEEGDRYMNALLYARDMEAKTYSFYSTEELDLNDICVLSHISEEGTYIRITDKQDNLDDFEGYTYTATVYSGTQVSTESYYIPASTNAPNVSQDFNFSVSRSLIVCDSDGNPLDSTAITARISLLKYYSVPTLLLDGTEVELTQDTQTVEDETVLLDSWHCEIDVSKIGTTSTLTAQLGDMTKTISIGKVKNGYVGSNGWSQATINLYKRSSTEQTGFDGGQLIYYFSTGGLTGSLGTWSRTVPSGSEKLWVISASAFAQSTSDEIEISDWTTPAVLSENGTVGQDGYTVLTVLLYQRSTTTPTKPTTTATYNFETHTITGVSPWTLTVPTGTAPVWVISATASTRKEVVDDITADEWSEPQILVQNGTDGKDGSSVEVQYSYSPSADTCYDEFIQWSDSDVYWGTEQALWNTWLANSPAEKEGYYIWMRARIGTADWQYTRLTGVQAKLFNLKCSQSTLTRNDRNETQGTVTFECDIQGYVDYTPSLTINGEEVALSISEGVYYYVYNYYYKNARSIEAKLFNGHELMDTVILAAVDETPPVAYIGVQDELPTKNGDLLLLEGDSCVYLGAVYIYQSVGGWKKTTESTLSQTARAQALTWAMNDVLKNIKDGSITATEYAYFENVVANIITASYIGSKTIELQEGGYIQSQGFNPDTSEKGFRLDYDGVLQTVRAIMKDVTINDGTLNAGALKTVNADTLSSWCATCGMPSENGKWSGVIKVVNEQGSSETVGTLNVTRTCYYNVKEWAQWFLDNVPVNNTAFTKLTGTIDGYNVYAMRFSQETWAQVFAQTCSWEIAEKSKSWEWTVSWEQYYKDLKIVIKNISQLTLAKSLTVSVDGVVKSTSASEGTITISQLSSGTHTISITVDTNKLNSGTFSVVASTSITSVYAGRLYKNATSGISSDRILLMLYSGTDDSIVFEGGTASNTLRVCSINSDSYPNGKMTNALYWESSFGDYYHTLATSLEKGGNSLICGSGYDDWNIQHYTQFAPLYEVGAYDSSTGAVVWKSTPSAKKACSYKVSNVFINGILYDKDFTVTWTGSVFNLASDDGTVNITYSTSEYYTSLSYISYAEVAESKGAYVASLYPIEKDVSDIGSVNQKFDTAYINTVHSDTVYGAKFSSTTLCNTTSTGTITLPDALTNYEWITMYVSYGGSAGLTGNVATFHSSNWSNWQTNNGILLFGDISNSSSKTYTVQITSATQLTATTSSVGFTLTVIGYK